MRFDIHYESTEQRARWWTVLVFWFAVLTILLGGGWLVTVIRDDRAPSPTPSPVQSLPWGFPHGA